MIMVSFDNSFNTLVIKVIITFALALAFLDANAQSKMITEVFKLIPANHLYGLTTGTRDSMLQGKTYYPADNDSSTIEAYNYGISEFVKDYMYVSLSYETMQRGSGMIEIRSIKINRQNLILVSATGGVWPINYQQNSFVAFIYDQNKKLVPYKKKLLPEKQATLFMKSGIPDSIRKVILNNANLTYNLSHENLTLDLNSPYLLNNPDSRKGLKGDEAVFTLSGDHFIIRRIVFSDLPTFNTPQLRVF